MCGIFGFVGDPDRARAVDLDAALRSLKHRGPDGRGTFRSWEGAPNSYDSRLTTHDSRLTNVACAFAHTRLAILDVSPAGHQPMTTPDGRYTIVYNGEVFNFRELREELEAGPHPPSPSPAGQPSKRDVDAGGGGRRPEERSSFQSNSDTEVILRAYERWGADCVRRFRGMFAFAIWDRDERSLFLARDRMGIKPLYYLERPDGLAFSSEVRTLLKTGLAERRLDPCSIGGYLAFGSVPEPETILEGVRALPPGHTAIFRGGRLSLRQYWSLPTERESRDAPDLLDLHSLLRDSVRMRLISDVPLGVFLSGGIDSSAVVALAAAASDVPIHTFTVTFDEERFSEETFAAEVASRFGCDHHQVHLSARRAASEIDDAVGALDQPSADGVNTYFVAKAAREAGLTVALSGLGGDELFAGYPNFRKFGGILRAGAAGRLLPFALRGPKAGGHGRVPHRLRKLQALLAAGGDPGRSYAVLRGMFLSDERDSLLARALALSEVGGSQIQNSEFKIHNSGDAVNMFSRLEISNYLRNTLLRDTDAMSMAHSLEVRVPFLDHLLVEQVLAISGRAKIAGRHNKPLLTSAVPEIPEQIVRRSKMGFTLPMDAWFRGPLKEWMSEKLSEESARSTGFLRPDGVSRLWQSFLRGEQYVSWSRVWSIAALAGWCRANGVSADFPAAPASRPSSREFKIQNSTFNESAGPPPGEFKIQNSKFEIPPHRVLLVLPAVFAAAGGIEMYGRLLVKGFGDILSDHGGACEVLVLNDRGGEFDSMYVAGGQPAPQAFARSKWRLVRAAFRQALRFDPDVIVFGHLNFAPLAALLKIARPRAKQWFVIYGIDAWSRRGPISRRALRQSDAILSISRYTKDEFTRSNEIHPEKVRLLPCALDPFFGETTSQPGDPSSAFGHPSPNWGGAGGGVQIEPSGTSANAPPGALDLTHRCGGPPSPGGEGKSSQIEQSGASDIAQSGANSQLTTHDSRPPTLLTVARLSSSDRYKGVDQVLRVLPEVLRSVPGVRYRIVGEGNDRPRLEKLAEELGVAENVEFCGRLPGAELARAYADCSLFVMPSSKEGFGIVYLEAARFGKASVAGKRGGSPEVVLDGTTGRIVDREDTVELTKAIVELLQDPAELARLGENARRRLEELYTYESFRKNLWSLFEEQFPGVFTPATNLTPRSPLQVERGG
ncbi:MAG: asparagine synthase (glutamine-hydrolyzing) [Thermoanaerobaculia bacterium]